MPQTQTTNPAPAAHKPKPVRCPRCAAPFAINPERRVAACPECGTNAGTHDITITENFETHTLRTTGAVTIEQRCAASIATLEATGPVTVRGSLEANITTRSTFTVERTGAWRGKATAAALDIHPHADAAGPVTIATTTPPPPPNAPATPRAPQHTPA